METPPVQIAAWLAALAFVLWILNQGKEFMDGFKEKPAPIDTYATKDEVAALRTELREARDALTLEGRNRATNIYGKLDALRLECKTDTQSVHKRIDDLRNEISDVPGEVIATLRNMGALK